MEVIRIPQERIKAFSENKGKMIREIEKACKVTLALSLDGDVEIEGEYADVYFAKDVIKAIARGFEPKIALRIYKDDFHLYIIDLKEFENTTNGIARLKGRIIGENGTMKTEIENATSCYMCIYGKTVSIIAKLDTLEYAKEAIGMLIDGAQHSSVFNFLAKAKQNIMVEKLKGEPI